MSTLYIGTFSKIERLVIGEYYLIKIWVIISTKINPKSENNMNFKIFIPTSQRGVFLVLRPLGTPAFFTHRGDCRKGRFESICPAEAGDIFSKK